MFSRVILSLLLVIGIAECKITHNFAEIFDQDDLKTTDRVQLTKCINGCYVYGSISKQFACNAADVTIVDTHTNQTVSILGDLVTVFTGDHGKKVVMPIQPGYYAVSKKAGADLRNCGFVIYAVSWKFLNTANLGSTPVYEASKYDKSTPNDTNVFTLMSADPFTLRQVTTAPGDQLSIYPTGYDVIISDLPDPCVPLYSGNDAQNLVHIALPTPLVTLHFATSLHFAVNMDSQIDGQTMLADGQHTAVISPGYHGCTDPQRFRYPQGQQDFTHEFKSSDGRPLTFNFNGHLSVYANDIITFADSKVIFNTYGYFDHNQDQQIEPITDTYVKMYWYDQNSNGTFGFHVSASKEQPTNSPAVPPSTTTLKGNVETTTKTAPESLLMSFVAIITARMLL